MTNEGRREELLDIFRAGLRAADPRHAVNRAVRREGEMLRVGERSYPLGDYDRVFVLGAGKAAAPMALALEEILADCLSEGRVIVKSGHGLDLSRMRIEEAGHPVPDLRGVEATARLLELAGRAGERDLVFCLISGGASALLEAPAAGLGLEDIRAMTAELLACGADIREFNTLRKHLSRVKGGRLARACAPATVVTLILSDVVGDPLGVIGSGPTVPDDSTFADCARVLEKYRLEARLPGAIVRVIREGQAGKRAETPKAGDPLFDRVHNRIVGSNLSALLEARDRAADLGYRPLILSTRLEGETRHVAGALAAVFREVRATGYPLAAPACILSGGETTVTLTGRGMGGRNTEFALAVALAIQAEDGLFFLSAGTDGTDGPPLPTAPPSKGVSTWVWKRRATCGKTTVTRFSRNWATCSGPGLPGRM